MLRLYFFVMKFFILFATTFFLLSNVNAFSIESDRSLLEKLLNKDLPGGVKHKKNKKQKSTKAAESEAAKSEAVEKFDSKCEKIDDKSLLEKILRTDLPGGNTRKEKCLKSNRQAKLKKKNFTKKKLNNFNSSGGNDISFYTGTFDLIDKEGDDQTSLFGLEHKNPNLFRDTFLGKFKPITGGFITGKSAVYLYTGVEAQYGIGPLKILPSLSPGYYQKGDGKDLGSALEFKSEVKFGLDIFDNSNLSYSYSHISNNDWGKTNPGTDNQQITFSKNF